MNETDAKICENILDALDRLFDRESKVIDIFALIFASSEALGSSVTGLNLDGLAIELEKISRNGKAEELQREEALQVTNNLRVTLNDMLSV